MPCPGTTAVNEHIANSGIAKRLCISRCTMNKLIELAEIVLDPHCNHDVLKWS